MEHRGERESVKKRTNSDHDDGPVNVARLPSHIMVAIINYKQYLVYVTQLNQKQENAPGCSKWDILV